MENKYFKKMKLKVEEKDIPHLHKKYNTFYHKLDGTHVDLVLDHTYGIKLITREGTEIQDRVPYIVESLNELDFHGYQGVYACELVHLESALNNPKDTWSKTRNVAGRKTYDPDLHKVQLVMYDIYETYEGISKLDCTNMPYAERRMFMPKWTERDEYNYLAHKVKDYIYVPTPYELKSSLQSMWEHDVIKVKREGFVLFNDREHVAFDKTFCKLKPDIDLDVVVLGFHEGKQGTRLEGKLGSFEVGLYKDFSCPQCTGAGCPYCSGRGVITELVSIGKVPTMSDSERVKWTERMEDYALYPARYRHIQHVIQVRATEWTAKDKLRFPSYVREREDKEAKECTWEQV